MFSTPVPFALSLSKGKRGVFQHPARPDSRRLLDLLAEEREEWGGGEDRKGAFT